MGLFRATGGFVRASPVHSQRCESQFGIPLTGTGTDLSTYGMQMNVDGGTVYDIIIDGPCVLAEPSASPVAGLSSAVVALMDSAGSTYYASAACKLYLPATASAVAIGRLRCGPFRRRIPGAGPVLLKMFATVSLAAGTATWGSNGSLGVDPALVQVTPVVLG